MLLRSALTLAMLTTACGMAGDAPNPIPEEALVVSVILTEFAVEMDRDMLPAGTPIVFQVVNLGSIDHNLILEVMGEVDNPLQDQSGHPTKIINLNPGESAQLQFVFERDASYGLALQLGCHLAGHYEAGMFQEFRVEG